MGVVLFAMLYAGFPFDPKDRNYDAAVANGFVAPPSPQVGHLATVQAAVHEASLACLRLSAEWT